VSEGRIKTVLERDIRHTGEGIVEAVHVNILVAQKVILLVFQVLTTYLNNMGPKDISPVWYCENPDSIPDHSLRTF
jgi:hypothetical protein